METGRLETFVRMGDVGSLTRAADVLHIAQPALSQQINALAAELGQRLLIRKRLEPLSRAAESVRQMLRRVVASSVLNQSASDE